MPNIEVIHIVLFIFVSIAACIFLLGVRSSEENTIQKTFQIQSKPVSFAIGIVVSLVIAIVVVGLMVITK